MAVNAVGLGFLQGPLASLELSVLVTASFRG